MLRKIFFLKFVLLLVGTPIFCQNITIATYNIRYDNKNDVGKEWKNRLPLISHIISFHAFDIVATQEGLHHQLNQLQQLLPQYKFYGKGRDDGKQAGEHSAIFYQTKKYVLLDSGDSWLSTTPQLPSKGWDATCCNRIMSWIKLKDKKTNNTFYVFNVHYDHEGQIARRESSHLIIKTIDSITQQTPFVLLGDFNANRSSEPYQIIQNSQLIKDAYQLATLKLEQNGSFNNWGKNISSLDVIDHIFTINRQFQISTFLA